MQALHDTNDFGTKLSVSEVEHVLTPPKVSTFFLLKLKYQICWLKLLVFLMFSGFEKTSKCKQCKYCRCLGGIPVFHDAFGTRRDLLLRDAGRVGVYASFMDVQTPLNIVPDTF